MGARTQAWRPSAFLESMLQEGPCCERSATRSGARERAGLLPLFFFISTTYPKRFNQIDKLEEEIKELIQAKRKIQSF